MVLKANDRRTSCPCHDEFRGPRSDYVRQEARHHLIHEPVPVHGPGVTDHFSRVPVPLAILGMRGVSYAPALAHGVLCDTGTCDSPFYSYVAQPYVRRNGKMDSRRNRCVPTIVRFVETIARKPYGTTFYLKA
ncbi:hypothetical protein TNCV_3235961 [Trichonephila clavipes]|nr:hypothetical protein TNCV_3235961 [Trichonephila clavipes]